MEVVNFKLVPIRDPKRFGSAVFVFDASMRDETIQEQMVNRRNRPQAEYRRAIEHDGMLRKLHLPANTTLQWSQKAGCKCPCSPGFRLIPGDLPKHKQNLVLYRRYVMNDDGEKCDVVVELA